MKFEDIFSEIKYREGCRHLRSSVTILAEVGSCRLLSRRVIFAFCYTWKRNFENVVGFLYKLIRRSDANIRKLKAIAHNPDMMTLPRNYNVCFIAIICFYDSLLSPVDFPVELGGKAGCCSSLCAVHREDSRKMRNPASVRRKPFL